MAHFFASIKGNRGEATRLGGKDNGITAYAASWEGGIQTTLYVDEEGRDCFRIEQVKHQGAGINAVIAEGFVGKDLPARIDGLR